MPHQPAVAAAVRTVKTCSNCLLRAEKQTLSGWADEGGEPYRLTVAITSLEWGDLSDFDLQKKGCLFTGQRSARPRDKGAKDKMAGKGAKFEPSTAMQGWASPEGVWLRDQQGKFELCGDLQPDACFKCKINQVMRCRFSSAQD